MRWLIYSIWDKDKISLYISVICSVSAGCIDCMIPIGAIPTWQNTTQMTRTTVSQLGSLFLHVPNSVIKLTSRWAAITGPQ